MKDRKRRGNSRYYLFFLLSLMAVVALSSGVVYALRHLSIFELQEIRVSGNLAVPDSLIQQASNKYLDTNLFRISKKRGSKRPKEHFPSQGRKGAQTPFEQTQPSDFRARRLAL
ncbi:MAG: hypothetical protein LRZ88_05145, partial [Candidatus Cloacimonetes bacterium]|nr:hypothetical protein [Candidatus Cloacimonadota bacterium]